MSAETDLPTAARLLLAGAGLDLDVYDREVADHQPSRDEDVAA